MTRSDVVTPKKSETRMKKLFGFEWDDFKSWNSFVTLMNRPEDPANLAIFRILFGTAMIKFLFGFEKKN
jgi:hypothetical protein